MTNTENVKAVIDSATGIATGVIEALEDGKISFPEMMGLIAPLSSLSSVDFKGAMSEWKDADAEARAEIISYAQSKITIGNAATEDKVEAIFGMLIYAGALLPKEQAA